LSGLVNALRKEGKKIVQCHGTFDLMHVGHIRHLENAKKQGDVLLVTVTADEYVNKGPGRPVFNQQLRSENLAALACVDYVAISDSLTALESIDIIKPHLYVKGSEYQDDNEDITGNISLEKNAVENNGGSIYFTNDITFSSSNLLNNHFDIFTKDTEKFLNLFKNKWCHENINNKISTLSNLNVLVIGDSIIDQYHYSSPMGQAGKSNILAVRYESDEEFAGGAVAVANHIAEFAGNVTLLTGVGDLDNKDDFIKSKLKSNVVPFFYKFKKSPTVIKRRYVDSELNKLFEVYYYNEEPEFVTGEEEVCRWLISNIEKYDLVVVPDFGNGFIKNSMVEIICEKSKYLAVNTQINSGNRGYHVINKYKAADFISLNEPEIRLAVHSRYEDLEKVIVKTSQQTNSEKIAVTLGVNGVIIFDKNNNYFHKIPALSTKVVDRIGAGDAFLSLCALCLANNIEVDVAAFIGSAAAAIDVQIVCNRETVSKVGLQKYISTLLK